MWYTNIGGNMLDKLTDKIFDLVIYVFSNNFIVKTYKLDKLDKYLEVEEGFDKIKNIKFEYKKDKPKMLQDNIKFKEKIEKFRKVLEENFDVKDLNNFYYNIEWVKIKEKNVESETSNGTYNQDTNKMIIYKNKLKTTIFHELFHLSSRDTTLKNFMGGFLISIDKYVLGLGLDEGYTELLAIRYFSYDNYKNLNFISNPVESRVALNLEKIVGMKKMQSLYLNANLVDLIKELEEYYTDKEIEQFLINLDVINSYQDKILIIEDENIRLNEVMEDIICFLIKGYSKKLLKENNSKEENIKLLEEYLNIVNITWDGRNFNYEYNIDRINSEISKVLDVKLDLDVLKINKTCYNK